MLEERLPEGESDTKHVLPRSGHRKTPSRGPDPKSRRPRPEGEPAGAPKSQRCHQFRVGHGCFFPNTTIVHCRSKRSYAPHRTRLSWDGPTWETGPPPARHCRPRCGPRFVPSRWRPNTTEYRSCGYHRHVRPLPPPHPIHRQTPNRNPAGRPMQSPLHRRFRPHTKSPCSPKNPSPCNHQCRPNPPLKNRSHGSFGHPRPFRRMSRRLRCVRCRKKNSDLPQ